MMNDFEEQDLTEENNMIVELNSEEPSEESTPQEKVEISDNELMVRPLPKREDMHKKKSLKEKWQDLPKGGKVAIILVPIVIFIILVILLWYFLVYKKDDEQKPVEKPNELIEFEKDNYKYLNGSLIFYDENDKEIGSYKCMEEDAEKCHIASLSNEDNFDTEEYVNTKGEKIVKNAKIFQKRYVFVFDEEKVTLYDLTKEEKIKDYELIKTGNITDSYVVVKTEDGKYGLLSFKENEYEEVIEPKYDYLGIIDSADTFVAKEGNNSFLVSSSDEVLTAKINGDIKKFNDKYLSIYQNENYSLFDYKGNSLTEGDVNYIDFKDGYIFLVRDDRIYAYDNEVFKLTETGLKLKNDNYKTSYVFDDKNNYKETKSAYTITTEEGKIIINIGGKDKEINVYEGMISKTLPYINYFDGSLFFYGDEDKTELLGSYTCTNENVIDKSTTTLDNCYIAKAKNIVNDTEEEGYLPIIAKRFAFVKDSPADKDVKIVLTDIENAKVLGNYYEVDITKRFPDITHIESLDELVYAKSSSSNKYGVIEIKDGNGTKKLDFKYTKISIFKNDYLLVQDDYYHLFPLKDLKEESEVIRSKYPIIDYSYGNFVVNKSNKYIVYNEDGKIIISDLDYAKLESDLLIGIKSNKLNIYPYEPDSEKILEEDIDLTGVKYTDILVKSDNGYVITIKTEDKDLVYNYNRQGKKVTSGGEKPTDKPTEPEEDTKEEEDKKGDNSSEKE